jgi:HEAT repeat protein
MPPDLVSQSQHEHTGVDPIARDAVASVLVAFGKALRAMHLYEPTSPVLDRFVGVLRDRFQMLWELVPSVTLAIDEDTISWEGVVVYRAESRTDPFIYPFYKDGVREIAFFPGVSIDEVDQLLEILGRVHHLRADEDDLLTLLWQHDWNCFFYQYVDLPNEGMELPGSKTAATAPVAAPREEPRPITTVQQDDFRDSPYFLDETELRAIREQLAAEMDRDLWRDVLNALFDRIEDGPPERQARIAELLREMLPALMGAGNLRHAAMLLGEVRRLFAQPELLAPDTRASLASIFEQLSQPEAVDELVRTIDEAPTAEAQEALGLLLREYAPEALGPLIRAAETVPLPSVRTTLATAAEVIAAGTPGALFRLFDARDPVVAAGAARMASKLSDPNTVVALSQLLDHRDERVRLAVVESLHALRSPGFNGAVQERLSDAQRDVRIAAARLLGAIRYSPARERFQEAIQSGRLKDRDVTERVAFYEAFGAVAGSDAVPALERVLNGRSWLGKREAGELRACAALGLGRTRAAAARTALQTAADDPDPVVRTAVSRALRTLGS